MIFETYGVHFNEFIRLRQNFKIVMRLQVNCQVSDDIEYYFTISEN